MEYILENDGNNSTETATGPLSEEDAASLLTGEPDIADAPDEPDGETAAEEGGEYEEGAEPTETEEELLFDINGQNVTLDEIGKGYLRQSDYTKKTQDLADERKQISQEIASIAAERTHLKQMLDMSSTLPDEPDWVQMATDDPLEYTRKRAIFDAQKAEREVKQAEAQRLHGVERQEQQVQFQEYVRNQAALMTEQIPELAGENASTYRSDLSTYMEGVGYSKQELAQLFDHRAVVAFDKARKYDALMSQQSATAKKVKGKPTVLKPGARPTKRMATTKAKQMMQTRLRKSGSVDDAVALLMG